MEPNNNQESNDERLEQPLPHQNRLQNQQVTNNNSGRTSSSKSKSCKGYLYYSSTLKSNGSNPRCIGIPRTLQQVPTYIVVQSEEEASREGRALTDFYYGCAGYSVYAYKDHSNDKNAAKPELPACVGLELLVDRRTSNSAPAHVHSKEGARQLPQTRELPQTRSPKPSHSTGDEFLSRFTRNAALVASGVAKNMRRVGHYVKESLDDIMYPYRRRPK